MKQLNLNNISEKVIYLIFWIFVFTFPVLLSPSTNGIDWNRASHELIRIIPFFLVFLINNFVLFSFFKNKRYLKYFLFTFTTIFIFSILSSFDYLAYVFLNISQPARSPIKIDTLWILNNLFYNFIFSLLVIGLNNAIKITFSWLEEKKNYEQLKKENLKNQLSILQHQISPHFFMNTLNNIHALMDYDKEIAKNSLVTLSKLMRVLLYENDNYTLQMEIDFLKDYIDLMKIRVTENVEIKFEYPEKIPHINFPTLLFISFVENSFKHGIKAIGKSFIYINFLYENEFLNVKILNSKNSTSKNNISPVNIGLNNSKKRLDLIYQDNYIFKVIETETTYEVNLKIPIHENKLLSN